VVQRSKPFQCANILPVAIENFYRVIVSGLIQQEIVGISA